MKTKGARHIAFIWFSGSSAVLIVTCILVVASLVYPILSATSGNAGETSPPRSDQITVAIPDTSSFPTDVLEIPIRVSKASGIAGAEIHLRFDPAVISIDSVTKTALTNDFVIVVTYPQPGEVRIGLANESGLPGGSGVLLQLVVRVESTAREGDSTSLTFTELVLFDEQTNMLESDFRNALFTVSFAKQFGDFPTPVELISGEAVLGDYNNDGALDLFLTGTRGDTVNPIPVTDIFANRELIRSDSLIGTGNAFVQVTNGAAAWGDYDRDGDLDIVLLGESMSGPIARVYQNHAGRFTEIHAGLTGVSHGAVAWGDFDNDGDLDLVVGGKRGPFAIAKLYRNVPSGFVEVAIDLTGVYASSFAWGDYDKDGDLDLISTGRSTSNQPKTILYRNDNGELTDADARLRNVWDGEAAWGDFDNDSDLDLVISGNATLDLQSGFVTLIYRNDGGKFTEYAALTGLRSSAAAWGDLENDGDLDLALTGMAEDGTPVSLIYRNNDLVFEQIDTGLPGIHSGDLVWGDLDNDGVLDLVLSGIDGTGNGFTNARRNQGKKSNTLPSAPTALSSTITGNTVTFKWQSTADQETPVSGLSYNLRIGRVPISGEIVTPMSDLETGHRLVVQTGNSGQIKEQRIENLEVGEFYWSAQAIDHSFAGSKFAPAESFTIGQTIPAPASEQIIVAPNPFTPNDDGFNDSVEFRLPDVIAQTAEILVYSIDGKRVAQLSSSRNSGLQWRGLDENGNALRPGVYLYVIKVGTKKLKDGTITLMR